MAGGAANSRIVDVLTKEYAPLRAKLVFKNCFGQMSAKLFSQDKLVLCLFAILFWPKNTYAFLRIFSDRPQKGASTHPNRVCWSNRGGRTCL